MGKLKLLSLFFRQQTPTWSNLYSISKSKIVRSSYVWFVFVPIIARILVKIESTLTFELFDRQITLSMGLPFTWQLFFFGATFILLANLVYIFRCPGILKKYPAFSDFQKEGQTSVQLIEIYIKLIASRMKSQEGTHQILMSLGEFFHTYCIKDESISNELKKDNPQILKMISKMNIEESSFSGAFIHVRNFGEKLHIKSIWLCSILYGIGIAFISGVFIQNICTVLSLTF